MKVLRVIASMKPENGGPCQGIRNSIPELAKFNAINEVVCLDLPDESYIKYDKFQIYALGPSVTPWCYSKKLYPWLIRNLGNYDVVIIHGLWQYHGYAVYKALDYLSRNAKNKQLPIYYVMPHGMLDPYFQKAPGRKLKAIRNIIYWNLIESKIVNSANGILFTCLTEQLLARTTFKHYFPKQELNIGYGIETPPVFNSQMKAELISHYPIIGKSKYLLFLSRLHPKKGIDMLIAAYKDLTKTFNDLPVLLIAGPGIETEYGKSLKRNVLSDPTIAEKVIFTGMISGNVKWGAYYCCEAFVLPSHQENFGIAVVEALACGKPVLISNQINICNEIMDSAAGIIEDDNQSGTLALLSRWHQLNELDRTLMGENATKLFNRMYSIDINVANLIKVLNFPKQM